MRFLLIKKIYSELGIKPIINAIGSVTLLGGSTQPQQVIDAAFLLIKKALLPILFAMMVLTSCATQQKKSKTPALFETKLEAEQAAKDFNCTGAHKMGDKWMPCEEHADHSGHHH